MKPAFLFLTALPIALLTTSPDARADCIFAHCDGDSVRLEFFWYGRFDDPTGRFLNVQERPLGSCQAPVRLNPVPYPYPPMYQEASAQLTLPADGRRRYMVYELWGEDAEGNPFPVPPSGDALNYDYEACAADALFVRGRLIRSSWNDEVECEPCEGQCWEYMPLDFTSAAAGWEAYVDTGQVVNIFGEAWVDNMPGAMKVDVVRVEPVTDPAGCEAVPIVKRSWGDLKSRYR